MSVNMLPGNGIEAFPGDVEGDIKHAGSMVWSVDGTCTCSRLWPYMGAQ